MVLVIAVLAGNAAAQSTAAALPAFDAVSVRPFRSSGRPWHRDAQIDPQRLYIQGMAPVELIDLAYSLNRNQLTGLLQWAQFSEDSLYSITATTSKPASRDQMLLMLRRVLAERFQLELNLSDKPQPVYDLEVAPDGPKLTPLQPDEDCDKAVGAVPRLDSMPYFVRLFSGCSVPDLVKVLNIPLFWPVDRPVIDKTQLTGKYVIVAFLQLARPAAPNEKVEFRETVAEALKSQLGLMLVKATGPYRRFTVTHIARPALEN